MNHVNCSKLTNIFLMITGSWFVTDHLYSQELQNQSWHGQLNHILEIINNYWGSLLFWDQHPLKLPFILIFLTAGGIFFTLKFRFVNIFLFSHAIRVLKGDYDDENHDGEISHFQALTSALSATVGLGNIAGVALAISLGGPGAVFWLWVVAFFGMSLKFSSCTLSQMYRDVKSDNSVLGGPMVFLEKGLADLDHKYHHFGKICGVIFAVFTIGASLGAGNLFQGNQSFELVAGQFPSIENFDWLAGLLLAFLIGIVILGGIKRIGEVTSKIVPMMCVIYCIICFTIIMLNLNQVPSVLIEIFTQAFNPDAMWSGGFVGVLTQGVKRGSFSNEAGIGSAAIAHAAAKTDRPIREGVVAMMGPFIDTHLVCTMTSLAILITGAHLDPTMIGKGSAITAKAFASLGFWVPYLLSFIGIIFAYSTSISWCYYGEKAVEYLFGKGGIPIFRGLFVLVAALGPVLSLEHVINFADLMLLSMAFPNIIGMFLLSSKIKDNLDVYKNECL